MTMPPSESNKRKWVLGGLVTVAVIIALWVFRPWAEEQRPAGVIVLADGGALLVAESTDDDRHGLLHRVDASGELAWSARLEGRVERLREGFGIAAGEVFAYVRLTTSLQPKLIGYQLVRMSDGEVLAAELHPPRQVVFQGLPTQWVKPDVLVSVENEGDATFAVARQFAAGSNSESSKAASVLWRTPLGPGVANVHWWPGYLVNTVAQWLVVDTATGKSSTPAPDVAGDVCFKQSKGAATVTSIHKQRLIRQAVGGGAPVLTPVLELKDWWLQSCAHRDGDLVVTQQQLSPTQLMMSRVEAATGRVLWSRSWAGSWAGTHFAARRARDPLRGSIHRFVMLRLFQEVDGPREAKLLMVDTRDGSLLWQTEARADLANYRVSKGAGPVHYLTAAGHIAAFDASAGTLLAAVQAPGIVFEPSQVSGDLLWLTGVEEGRGYSGLAWVRLDARTLAVRHGQNVDDETIANDTKATAKWLGIDPGLGK